MGAPAFLVLAVMVAITAADYQKYGPFPDREIPYPHGSAYLPPFHVLEDVHYKTVKKHKLPEPLNPINLPPVLPNYVGKPIEILGKHPIGSPKVTFSAITAAGYHKYGPFPDYEIPHPHGPANLHPLHVLEHVHYKPVKKHKLPEPLNSINLPPVLPNDAGKPIEILGKRPIGGPQDPFSPFDDGTCSMEQLQWPCPKTCSLEWNPVYAANKKEKRVVTFINCCAWRWHVCHYKKPFTYLGRANAKIYHNEKPSRWPKDWPNEWPKDWPKENPNKWMGEWDWYKQLAQAYTKGIAHGLPTGIP